MRYLIIFTSLVFMVNNSNAEPAEYGWEANKSHSREYGQFRPVQRMISDHRKDHRRDVWSDPRTGNLGWSSYYRQNFRSTIRRPDHQRHHRKVHSSRQWITAGDFRSRRSHDSDPIIEVNDRVNYLGLQGTKRSVYVERAYIEFGNGQTKRIRSLEGIIHDGEQHRHQLARTRQVSRVYLHLSPLVDRGYARLTYAR